MQSNHRAGGQGRHPGEARDPQTLSQVCWGSPAGRRSAVSRGQLLLALLLGVTGTGELMAIHLWLAPRLAVRRQAAVLAFGEDNWSVPLPRCTRDAGTVPLGQSSAPVRPLSPTLYFERDEYRLHSGHRWVLGGVVDKARAAPGRQLLIRGHADRTGPAGWNGTLSRKRALSVAAFLRDHGLEWRRLIVEACADSIPARPDADEAMNRRVEVYWR